MTRRSLALLATLLLLTLATYIYYRRTLAAVPVDAYALVPDDAVLVLTTRDHPTLVRHLQDAQLWDNLTAVRYVQQAADHLALADSLAGGGRTPRLVQLLGRKQVVTSVHITGPATFDVLYQVPLATVREYRDVRSLLETLGRDHRYRLTLRDLDGQELSVLTDRRTEASLTVFNYRNHLVMSTNVALVEAVVRRVARPEAPTVLARFADTDVLRLREVDASLWVNYRRLPQLLDVLFRPAVHAPFDHLTSLAADGLMGWQFTGPTTGLTGFATPEESRGSLHRLLQGQPAQPLLGLTGVLPTRTALLLALATRPVLPPPSAVPDSLGLLGVRAALDSLVATFGPEMSVAYLAAPTPGSPAGRVAYVRCPNAARTARWLAEVRRRSGASPAFTKVGTFEIHPLGFSANTLLRPLLTPGPLAGGEESGALANGYLLLGEAAVLNIALADVAAGLTWDRTPAYATFLARTQPRARLSIYLDTRQAWNGLLGALPEDRRAGLLRNEALFRHYAQMALQVVPAADEQAPAAQYYTRLLLHQPSEGPTGASGAAPGERGLTFRAPLVGVPLLLPAAGTRRPAVVVQDSAGVLYSVSSDNTVVWVDSLNAPAVGVAVLPAGPGTAGGLVLAAGHRVQRLGPADGRAAVPFPLNLPDTVRATDLVLHAPPAAAPRLLITAGGGSSLFLLDVRGRQYPGWGPKQLDFPLAGAPALLNVGGRDVVVAPLQNGYVYAYDQRGGLLAGFPLSVGARLAGGVAVQAGNTLSRTRLTVINQHGELVTFTLGGDVLGRRRVATWSRTATFRLVPDARTQNYLLLREDGGRLDAYLPTGTVPLLTRQFVTSGFKPAQYFDFGPGRRVLALTELGPGLVYLFNEKGQPMSPEPLPSTGQGVGLLHDAPSNTFQLVRLVGRELRRLELRP